MVAKNKSYEEFYEEEEKKTSFTRTKNEDEVFYEDDDEEFSTPPKEQQHGSYVQEAIVCVHTLVHRSKVGVVVGLGDERGAGVGAERVPVPRHRLEARRLPLGYRLEEEHVSVLGGLTPKPGGFK